MGEMVEFPSNGGTASGYLVTPEGGSGPGVLVIQEWWGLDSGIKEMADRLGAAGFVALGARPLPRRAGRPTTRWTRPRSSCRAMPPDRAGRDMSGAVDYLAGHEAVTSDGIGVVGFCMGGLLVVHHRRQPPGPGSGRRPLLRLPPRGHGAGLDRAEPRSCVATWPSTTTSSARTAAKALEAKLQAVGKDVILTVHPGTGHAFMAPHNALGTLDEELAGRIWPEVVAFLHDTLD